MTKISVKVDHELGAAEAMKRLRAAADAAGAKASSFVNKVEWNANGAVVDGKGFSGSFAVGERDVTIDADLGFPANLMPLKIQRDAEDWLRKTLAR